MTKKICVRLFALMFVFLFCGCRDKDEIHVSTYFDFSISKDLLELVTPVVSYSDNEGNHETELTSAVCDTKDNVYVWSIVFKNDDRYSQVYNNDITLKFKSNGVSLDSQKQYDLRTNSVVSRVEADWEDGDNIGQNSYTNIKLSIGGSSTYSKDAAESFISRLIGNSKIFSVQISKGEITVLEK